MSYHDIIAIATTFTFPNARNNETSPDMSDSQSRMSPSNDSGKGGNNKLVLPQPKQNAHIIQFNQARK